MNAIHYIGLDVHKKTISYCIKTAAGQIVKEGTLAAVTQTPSGLSFTGRGEVKKTVELDCSQSHGG
jgi:hypothetical protein